MNLVAGKSYWFAASGCPRMGNIRIAVTKAGKTMKSDEGHQPSICVKVETTGSYSIRVKALSLTRSSSWGSIDSALSDSNCASQ